jgi:hypothetical protein
MLKKTPTAGRHSLLAIVAVTERGLHFICVAATALLPLIAGWLELVRPGRLDLDFSKLSFHLPPGARVSYGPDGGFAAHLPEGIKVCHGRDIRIAGYMLPAKRKRVW